MKKFLKPPTFRECLIILIGCLVLILGATWADHYTQNTAPVGSDYFLMWDVGTGKVEYITHTNLAASISSGGTHASTHIDGGADEIDADQAVISWVPTYYTRATTPTEVSALDQLTAHLYGIDRHARWHTAGLADPDVALAGRIGIDTNNHALRGYDGTDQYVYGHKEKFIDFSIEDPDQLNTGTGRADKWVKLICNRSDFAMIILEVYAYSDSQNYDFNLFETNGATDFSQASDSLIDLIECDSAGTGVYYDQETTISDPNLDSGDCILFVHSAGTSGKVAGTITYFLDGDVN